MARIAGVDVPREKRLEISLTYIFGIGRTTSQQICEATDINRDTLSMIDDRPSCLHQTGLRSGWWTVIVASGVLSVMSQLLFWSTVVPADSRRTWEE